MIGGTLGGVKVGAGRSDEPLRSGQGIAAFLRCVGAMYEDGNTTKSKLRLASGKRVAGAEFVLKVPYTFENVHGELTLRCDGHKWHITPDRGSVNLDQWRPDER